MSSVTVSPSVSATVSTTYNATPITLTDGQSAGLQADVNGYLKVNLSANDLKGQGLMAASIPVVIASNQSAIPSSQSGTWNMRLQDGAGSAVNKGQGLMAASLPVVIASDQSALPASQSGNWNMRLQDGAGSAVNKGQGLMAASLPVVLASDQSAIPASQSGTWNMRLQDGAGSAVNKGQGLMAASLPVVLASDQSALPASQSGNWSMRLQDGAGSAVNKGQTTMAGSLPVVLASDQASLPVAVANQSVIDQIDNAVGPVLDTGTTAINGNAGAFVAVVATLAAACKKVRVSDTTGGYIGVYTGAAASEVLAFIVTPGMDDYIEQAIPINTRISVRSMLTTGLTQTGATLVLQFCA